MKSALNGQVGAIETLRKRYVSEGYALVGFYGTSKSNATKLILCGLKHKKHKKAARGAGLYLGSLATGIPTLWAKMKSRKDSTPPLIVSVYVKDFNRLVYGTDYDWGKMDCDDIVGETGFEMVIFPRAFESVRLVPGRAATPALWKNCPKDSLTFSQRKELGPAVRKICQLLNLAPKTVKEKIESEDWTKEQKALLKKTGF